MVTCQYPFCFISLLHGNALVSIVCSEKMMDEGEGTPAVNLACE